MASYCFETRGQSSSSSSCSLLLFVVNHSRLLLGILNLILHGCVLVDLELDLALLLQLGQHHEGLVVISIVDQSTDLLDLLVSLESLFHLVDTKRVVNLLLSTIRHALKLLEVDHGWLNVVVLLLLKLHTHQLILHLHELVWHHSKLLVLRIVSTSLWVEHHLHVHVWIDIVHSLAREAHLVLHHHTGELVHILHTIHSHRGWHLVAHSVVLANL